MKLQGNSVGIDRSHPLAIVVIGASGDLALRKIYPALFALHCQDLLPEQFHIVGFARSEMTHDEFRKRVESKLTCRYVPGERCDDLMNSFLARCTYMAGSYNSPESFDRLHAELNHVDPNHQENRIFYMAIPPFLFLEVAHALRDAHLVSEGEERNWSRVVIEKPFGSDRASSDALTESMGQVFSEAQTYRIDHYLGKEVIQNLLVLRFANLIFDPIWNRDHIRNVRITWTEDLSLEGRAGYFDQYGIIRDVMQNHLLQMVALVAMEQPVGLNSTYVRDEKVKALRAVPALTLDDLVVAQYGPGSLDGKKSGGYLKEEGTPAGSITPTYAAAALQVKNHRWDGVPFLIRAGKGLQDCKTEIKIRFRGMPGNIFANAVKDLGDNELVIRVQPDAGISFRIVNRVPGLGIRLKETELDLRYSAKFEGTIPDAYESLILDVILGDKSLFIRADELEAAWDIFTPALHELEAKHVVPDTYAFGSDGPASSDALAARHEAQW